MSFAVLAEDRMVDLIDVKQVCQVVPAFKLKVVVFNAAEVSLGTAQRLVFVVIYEVCLISLPPEKLRT